MRLITTLYIPWSMAFTLIDGIQLSNNPKLSTRSISTLHQATDVHINLLQHQQLSSRRNALLSIATGVGTSLSVIHDRTANAATTTTTTTTKSSFRAYQIQPDPGENLNPTLITLTVRCTFIVSIVHTNSPNFLVNGRRH
jgi:hypothetical protein